MSPCRLFWSPVANFLQKPDARLSPHTYSRGTLRLLGIAGCRVGRSQRSARACGPVLCPSVSVCPPCPAPDGSPMSSVELDVYKDWVSPGFCWVDDCLPPSLWSASRVATAGERHQSPVFCLLLTFLKLNKTFFSIILFLYEFITHTSLPTVVLMEFSIYMCVLKEQSRRKITFLFLNVE